LTSYDRTGRTYSVTRQPDPRIGTLIERALQGMSTVANIGAGTGSYEPSNTVIAVEPSHVMVGQRRSGAAPAVRAAAERLPIGTDAVDASIALLTVHHWTDIAAGIAEMIRVARRRVVIFTWDNNVFRRFWLLRDYLPSAADTDARLAVPIDRLAALLGDASIHPVPVPHDCADGFGGAYWRRPHAYLDETVRAGMSLCALTPKTLLESGLQQLETDLGNGAWARRHADLLELPELDLGYRLLVADLKLRPESRRSPRR
jgi:SAM-dependent methyltransferase